VDISASVGPRTSCGFHLALALALAPPSVSGALALALMKCRALLEWKVSNFPLFLPIMPFVMQR
jgi:hypothetical protein